MKITIALADDHVLLRRALANLLSNLDYEIVFEADDGMEFLKLVKTKAIPQVAIIDINMPIMDGYQTAQHLKHNYPDIAVLALSMYDDENAIVRMIKNGARGYILKDSEPSELRQAISDVLSKGFYHSELVTNKLIHTFHYMDESGNEDFNNALKLSQRELEFLRHSCSELTYKEIAVQMNVSQRTVDGYRDNLFEKLNLKSRVGLVMFAIKHHIVIT
jgi:DNA-binding NarL/FixJ family response regulator